MAKDTGKTRIVTESGEQITKGKKNPDKVTEHENTTWFREER